jgi:hypothetical protein
LIDLNLVTHVTHPVACQNTITDFTSSCRAQQTFHLTTTWLLESTSRYYGGRSSGNTFKGGGERGGRHVGRPRRNFSSFFFFTLFQDTLGIVLPTNSLLRDMETPGRHPWICQRQVGGTVSPYGRQGVLGTIPTSGCSPINRTSSTSIC